MLDLAGEMVELAQKLGADYVSWLGGDILTLLKNVEIVGNDAKQVLFYDAALLKDVTLIVPSILVKNVSVSA